jgi:hypothetical protein
MGADEVANLQRAYGSLAASFLPPSESVMLPIFDLDPELRPAAQRCLSEAENQQSSQRYRHCAECDCKKRECPVAHAF